MIHYSSKIAPERKGPIGSGKFFHVFLALGILALISSPRTWAGPVTIQAQNEFLASTLERVQAESGIRFKLSPSLAEERITGNIQADDWQNAVRRFLDRYNRLEVIDDSGWLTKVFLLGVKTRVTTVAAGFNPEKSMTQPMTRQEIILSQDQLLEIAEGPIRKPIPERFYHQPEYHGLLSGQDITSKDKLTNTSKAMRVRIEARRQLKLLQE